MNQSATDLEAETEKPENEQNDDDGPQHRCRLPTKNNPHAREVFLPRVRSVRCVALRRLSWPPLSEFVARGSCRESNPQHAGTNLAAKGAVMSRNPLVVAVALCMCAIAVSATVGCSCSANIGGTTPDNGGSMNRNGGSDNNSGGGTNGNSGGGMMGGSGSGASTGTP